MPENSATGARSEITVDTVRHLAGLAQIAVSEEETESLTHDLSSILQHIAQVSEAVQGDVPATSHPLPINNVMRPDVVADVLTREEALRNAPDAADGMFRVSSILGEEQ